MPSIPRTQRRRSIVPRIRVVRGQRIILDADLAALYGVATSQLNQALKRNQRRFPSDFAFRLSARDVADLKSQTVISRSRHGGRRTAPWAYTEHGVIMAASMLNSMRAIHMSVFVVRAFVRVRKLVVTHAALAEQLAILEHRVTGHDAEIGRVVAAIRTLLATPVTPRRRIGFGTIVTTGITPVTRPANPLAAAVQERPRARGRSSTPRSRGAR